jgi:uncharacterized membrane protein YkvA (DUF1232 family)
MKKDREMPPTAPDGEVVAGMKIGRIWKNWAHALKLQSFTLYYAYKDPRTPWYAKAWTAMVVAYAFSPIDIIPDFIPILGYLDDLILIPLGIALAVRLIPKEVLTDSRILAQQRLSDARPKNWTAAAVVIVIWIGALAVITYLVVSSIARKRR